MNKLTIEEICNATSHGIGALLSIIALVAMIHSAIVEQLSFWHKLSFTIYGVSMICLYLSSTLYHSFFKIPKLHDLFKIFDHISIYLLIAGTYTPFLFIPLNGPIGLQCAIIVWSMALVGIAIKCFFAKRFRLISTLCYLGMGWMIMFYIKPLLATIPLNAFYFLLAGGLSYTIGAIFYLLKKIPFSHFIWHLFVLGGSISHFIAVFYYLRDIPIFTY